MKKTFSKIFAAVMAVISILMTTVPAIAAEAVNSTASRGSDIAVIDDNSFSVAGVDSTQNQKSEYESYNLNGNDIVSNVNVYGTVAEGSNVYDPENPDADDNGFVNGKIQVGVPTTIIIGGTPNAQGYYTGAASGRVKGNISGSTVINVIPDSSATLKSEGKEDVVATIEQDYEEFTVATSEYSGDKVNKSVTPEFNDDAVFNVEVKTKDISAGSWHGTFNYNISLLSSDKASLGRKVTSWNISATDNDNVWMTYYQPRNVAPKTSSTTVTTYEDGTVVVSGTGNMENNVNSLFYDLDAMSEYANKCYWENVQDTLTEEEYAKLLEYVEVGTPIYVYESAGSAVFSDEMNALPQEARQIAQKAWSLNWINESKYKIYHPKKIIIEDGVTNISDSAFSWCNEATSVTIGNDVTTIGKCAFQSCYNLTEIRMPESITEIGASAFAGCGKVESIRLGANVTTIKNNAFSTSAKTIYCATQEVADLVTASFLTASSNVSTIIVE
ncbi:MAG: leucine-rich repeat domain-containing protein [Eubacterium sp.]|nr:leucine-rich repeat domain-containing protein [Eubacterium sp.]